MADATSELQGWKEIAAYLGRSTRAAQRWEAQYGLPVRRVGGTVFADRAELDAWKRSPGGQSAAHAPRGADEDESVAHQAPAVGSGPASTPAAPEPAPSATASSPPPLPAPAQVPAAGPARWFAGARLWWTTAALLGGLTLAATLLLARGDSVAGWLRGRSIAPPASGWDRLGLDQGPWPAEYHDHRQSAQGHVAGPADAASPRLLVDPGDTLTYAASMIVTAQGLLVAGTCDGRVFATHLDGRLAWVQSLDRQHNAEAAAGFALGVQAQVLVVPTGECPHNTYANVRTQLHLLRALDGASLVRLRTGAMTLPPAIGLTTTIYQVDQYNTLRAIDVLGDLKWTVDLPGFTATPPVQDAHGTLYVATDGGLYGHRSVWSISPLGEPAWNVEGGLFLRLAMGPDGHLYGIDANHDIAGRSLGPHRLVSITTDGRLRWEVPFPGWTHVGVRDSLAVGPSGPVVRTQGAVIALSPAGAERWRVALPARMPQTPGFILDRDETAYVAAADQVVAIDRNGRERWRVPVPQAGRIILAGEGLLAVTSANRRILLVHDRGIDPARLAPDDTP